MSADPRPEPTILWSIATPGNIPARVACTGPTWPATEVESGAHCYVNTHFSDEADAWAAGRREVEAGVALERREVEQARAALARAEARLAEGIAALARFSVAENDRAPAWRGEP